MPVKGGRCEGEGRSNAARARVRPASSVEQAVGSRARLLRALQLLVQLVEQRLNRSPVVDVGLVLRSGQRGVGGGQQQARPPPVGGAPPPPPPPPHPTLRPHPQLVGGDRQLLVRTVLGGPHHAPLILALRIRRAHQEAACVRAGVWGAQGRCRAHASSASNPCALRGVCGPGVVQCSPASLELLAAAASHRGREQQLARQRSRWPAAAVSARSPAGALFGLVRVRGGRGGALRLCGEPRERGGGHRRQPSPRPRRRCPQHGARPVPASRPTHTARPSTAPAPRPAPDDSSLELASSSLSSSLSERPQNLEAWCVRACVCVVRGGEVGVGALPCASPRRHAHPRQPHHAGEWAACGAAGAAAEVGGGNGRRGSCERRYSARGWRRGAGGGGGRAWRCLACSCTQSLTVTVPVHAGTERRGDWRASTSRAARAQRRTCALPRARPAPTAGGLAAFGTGT